MFEKGCVDKFLLDDIPFLGDLWKIIIGHDNSGIGAAWFLDKVVVDQGGMQWNFPCYRWLAKNEDDHLTERELLVSKEPDKKLVPEVLPKADLKVSASASVSAPSTPTGSLAVSATVPQADLKGSASVSLPSPSTGTGSVSVAVNVPPVSGTASVSLSGTVPASPRTGSGTVPTKPAVEPPKPAVAGAKPAAAAIPTVKYTVIIHTGSKRSAGTDAAVYIELYGASGATSGRIILKRTSPSMFERKSVDKFVLDCPPLGDLQRIIIGHDNTGPGPAWFLDKVIITEGKDTWTFTCDRWLAKDEDDKKIERELWSDKIKKADVKPEPKPMFSLRISSSSKKPAETKK
eukprot:TRINITY_DN133_c0_g1_i13.p1 TRINITY_DN133_c0_g1~~TRINITY_DN133_c0_g1_i13.p1  ORF type:complete len:346 (-),score=66.93 TRINITY_DN133_c0_g1_i13:78-1115(-)